MTTNINFTGNADADVYIILNYVDNIEDIISLYKTDKYLRNLFDSDNFYSSFQDKFGYKLFDKLSDIVGLSSELDKTFVEFKKYEYCIPGNEYIYDNEYVRPYKYKTIKLLDYRIGNRLVIINKETQISHNYVIVRIYNGREYQTDWGNNDIFDADCAIWKKALIQRVNIFGLKLDYAYEFLTVTHASNPEWQYEYHKGWHREYEILPGITLKEDSIKYIITDIKQAQWLL
jgi:hypothetical protein